MPVGITAATIWAGVATGAGTAIAGVYGAHAASSAAEKGAALQAQAAANQLAYLKDQSDKAQKAADKAAQLEKERYDATWKEKMTEYNNAEAVKAPYRTFGNNALATLGGMIYGPSGGGTLGRLPDPLPPPSYTPPSTTPPSQQPGGSNSTPAPGLFDPPPGATAPLVRPSTPPAPTPSIPTLGAMSAPPASSTSAPPLGVTPVGSAPATAPLTTTSGMTMGDLGGPMVTVRDPTGRLVQVPQRLAALYAQSQGTGNAPPPSTAFA